MFPTIDKPSSKRAYFGDNTISQDVLIDTSLNPSFVSCLSSPQQPWSKAWFSHIVAELLICHFSKIYVFFSGKCYHVDKKYVVSLSKYVCMSVTKFSDLQGAVARWEIDEPMICARLKAGCHVSIAL